MWGLGPSDRLICRAANQDAALEGRARSATEPGLQQNTAPRVVHITRPTVSLLLQSPPLRQEPAPAQHPMFASCAATNFQPTLTWTEASQRRGVREFAMSFISILCLWIAACSIASAQTVAQRGKLSPEEHSKYVALGVHINVWMSLDGTRDRIEHLSAVPSDHWVAPLPSLDNTSIGTSTAHDRLCAGTFGSWCRGWLASPPVATKLAVPGDKACRGDCNGVGTCNYNLGICQCPAGWTGDDCTTPFKRPCSNRFRDRWDDPPASHLDEHGEDLDLLEPGWTTSRCAGWCDDSVAACYCGYNATFGHVPVPQGLHAAATPRVHGRPLVDVRKPSTDKHGNKIPWVSSKLTWDDLYGPTGWCQVSAENNTHRFECHSDLGGPACSQQLESFCLNQCTGHGVCKQGFCHCNDGWYGTACDQQRMGLTTSGSTVLPRHLRPVVKTPGVVSKPQRKRPLIYVYDLPPDYNTRILQYIRASTNHFCSWRSFDKDNNTIIETNQHYFLETYIHEQLLISPHRTMDPEEADFFYVPIYSACFVWPVLGWADGPWYYEPTSFPRPMHIMNMMLEAKHWIQRHFPYWDRRAGKDHIFLMAHDEGACYAPNEIYQNAIMLVHWGRTDLNHTSGTAYSLDDYSARKVVKVAGRQDPVDWVTLHEGHPCYTPGKDLVIPAMQALSSFPDSPLLGHPPYKRDILFFFRGDVGMHRLWWYSRGIRQSLYRLAMEDKWREKHNIIIGTPSQYPGPYSTMAARSKFCLVAMGDGWSARSEVAVLHGCIPVLINDGVEPILHGLVDWDSFSLRVPQARLAELPQILLAVNDTQLESMQRALAHVWTRFMYATGPTLRTALHQIYSRRRSEGGSDDAGLDDEDRASGSSSMGTNSKGAASPYEHHPFKPLTRFPAHRDAFSTIIQWLHSRIPHVTG